MASENDDKGWIADLESALNEECRHESHTIPPSLRPEVWKSCLSIHSTPHHFEEIFDLPEQDKLRQDCQNVVDKLGNEDYEKLSVLSDLESILTYHRKRVGVEYSTSNGWIDILMPLVALKIPRSETWAMFESIIKKFIPKQGNAIYSLLRLLILYHDPQLCSFLDTKRITPDSYASSWFQSLFAASCSLPTVTAVWDLYFQQADPFFILFLGLVLSLNARDRLMGMTTGTKAEILEVITNRPASLQVEDVEDFFSLAQYYSTKTPGSFRQVVEVIFEDEESSGVLNVEQALCLPVSVRELVENITLARDMRSFDDGCDDEGVRFFLIDCRPAEEYNAGHLPTAFHLDCNLMLQGQEVFNTAVQALFSAKKHALASNSSAGGEHLCFMGCGSLLTDQNTHMVVASFLHSNTQYVTLLTGGYAALHEYFGDSVEMMLSDHNNLLCRVCIENGDSDRNCNTRKPSTQETSPSKDFLGKLGAAVKMKSAEVKGKLLEYIVNPGGSVEVERHVRPQDKIGKRYRNLTPVFSIDDDHDPEADPGADSLETFASQFEVVSLSSWMKKPDILATFPCHEVKTNGDMYQSQLLVSPTHVFVLREMGKKDQAEVVVKRPLSAIAKITCKKRTPQRLTFKYGATDGESLIISDMDRFIIPRASEATEVIRKQIDKLLEKRVVD